MNCLFVLSKHGLESVDIAIILFFLQSYIHDCLRDIVVHFLKLFSLLDEHSEIVFEVDLIVVISIH